MAYVEDISFALIRALDQPTFHKGARLEGYKANLDFWVEEIRHCLDVLAGYDARFERLAAARQEHAKSHREELDQVLVTRTVTAAELSKLDARVREAAARFLRACIIPYQKAREIEDLLGIRGREEKYYD